MHRVCQVKGVPRLATVNPVISTVTRATAGGYSAVRFSLLNRHRIFQPDIVICRADLAGGSIGASPVLALSPHDIFVTSRACIVTTL